MSGEVPNSKVALRVDLRLVCIVLLLIIFVMLAMWRPWAGSTTAADRTIEVSGEAKVKAEPDEYVFYPSYRFDNPDKNAALAEASKKSEEIVAKLKTLGVEDKNIKTSTNNQDFYYYHVPEQDNSAYVSQLTITVASRDIAQKIQDYLVTTTPIGAVSPQATFSDAKRKEVENQARDEATKEARAKADQSAKNLGFRIGKVKSVNDGAGFGGVMPMEGRAGIALDSTSPSSKLSVQPGENELHYSVTVVYFLK